MITTTLTSPCHRKTLVPFCLRKKILENAVLTLTVNSQNRTEKQIISFKTTVNSLLNNMRYYLVIGSFDSKIGIFQQTVVRGLLYP